MLATVIHLFVVLFIKYNPTISAPISGFPMSSLATLSLGSLSFVLPTFLVFSYLPAILLFVVVMQNRELVMWRH